MFKRWSTRRFDAAELSLIVVLVAAAAVFAGSLVASRDARRVEHLSYVAQSAALEFEPLRAKYGPAKFSRNEEEWIIRDYFQDRRGGTFVDIGANHYKSESNTYYLESTLGWTGIAVDPQAVFAADYRLHRPGTRFFALFVSDASDSNVTFYLAEGNPLVASADRQFAGRGGAGQGPVVLATTPTSVPTITLTDLLDETGLPRFDLLSVDVELAEPKVLAGFEIDRFRPSLVCIEAHPQVRQETLDYFAAHGYVLLGRYLRADLQNLYFAPIGLAGGPPASGAGSDPFTPGRR